MIKCYIFISWLARDLPMYYLSNFPVVANKVTNLPKDKCAGDNMILNALLFQNAPY